MFDLSLLLVVVTVILVLAWCGGALCRGRIAERDFVWRVALVGVAVAPLLVLAHVNLVAWQWSLGILPGEKPVESRTSPATEAATDVEEAFSEQIVAERSSDEVRRRDRDVDLDEIAAGDSSLPAAGFAIGDRSADVAAGTAAAVAPPPDVDAGSRFVTLFSIAWGVGIVFGLLRLAHGAGQSRRLIASSKDVIDEAALAVVERARTDMGLRGSVEIATSPDVPGPIVVGVVRPRIVIPSSLLAVEAREHLRIALLHECGHIRRHDMAFEVLQQLAATAYWFHPLVYVMNRALRQLREELCDNHVLAEESAVNYAETLLRLAVRPQSARSALVGMGMLGTHRPLVERVESLLTPSRSTATSPPRCTCLAIVGIGMALALSIALVRINSVAADDAPKDSTAKTPPPATSIGGNNRVDSKPVQNPARGDDAPGDNPKPVAQSVTGTVLAADGSPVLRADVYLLANSAGGALTLPTHPQKTSTDAAGLFEFRDVAEGSYRVWGESGNRISNEKRLTGERVQIAAGAAPAPITLKLFEGRKFRVSVRKRADGKPLAGAFVRFRWPDIERKFVTNAEGVALVEGVRSGELVFEARADDYTAESKTIAETKAGSTTELEFLLDAGGTIRGVVRESDGAPVVGMGVGVSRDDVPVYQLANMKTDAEGRFVFENLPLGVLFETALSHDDYLDVRRKVALTRDEPSASVALLAQRRPIGGSILVEVAGPDGKPVSGATLVNPSNRSNRLRTGSTDAMGRCRLDDVVDRSGRHELTVKAKGLVPQHVDFKPGTSAAPTTVRVRLVKGHTFRGRVLLSDGKPASKAWVSYNDGDSGNPLGGGVATDAEGRFAIDSLPADSVFTVRSPSGHAPFTLQKPPLDGKNEVVLRLEAAGIVRGLVLDDVTGSVLVPYRVRIMVSRNRQPGEPAPDLDYRLVSEGRIVTAADGAFRFDDFPQGAPMQLIVSADGYEERTLERVVARVANQSQPVEIRLRKIDRATLRQVAGRLLDAQGRPVGAASLRLWTSAVRPELGTFPTNWKMIVSGHLANESICRQYLSATTDAAGRFSFSDVRAAEFAEIAWWGSGIAPGRQRVQILRANDGQVAVELKAAAPAALQVEIDPVASSNGGHLILSGSTMLMDFPIWPFPEKETSHLFENLPAGELTVMLNSPTRRVGSGNYESKPVSQQKAKLVPGKTTTVKFGPTKSP